MNLIKLAIENHRFTIMVFLLLMFMGINSIITMPRTEDPPLDLPGASIIAIYPGGNPADLEELIAIPVEEALNELENIKLINAVIRDGIVSVAIEFEFTTNANEKFNEVVRQVNNIRNNLPQDLYSLQVLKWSSTDVVMLQLALSSETAGYERLYNRASRLKEKVERIPGIRLVEIMANPKEEVRVSLNMDKMAVMGVSADDVERAIQSNNTNIPGGELVLDGRSFNVKSSGSFKELDEIRNTVVSSWMGQIVYLKDIATVEFQFEDISYAARTNGVKSVFITLKQKENLNIFSIFRKINPEIEAFRKALDHDISLVTVFDQAESVNERINGFFMNLLQGIALVGAVIFLSLGFRASLLVILAIPMSIVIGLGWVDLSGYGLQQISIAALVIALGLLVDNSIVVTESIERFIRKGQDRKDAAIGATLQLARPVLSATLTTMLAFIPIIMMRDKSGAFIESLPVTVILTLLASLLIALILTPYLASKLFRKQDNQKEIKSSKAYRRFPDSLIQGPYRNTLIFSLQKPWYILLASVVSMGLAVLIFMKIGVVFFPKAEKPQFLIRVHMPEGTAFESTDRTVAYVESVLDTIPSVKVYASNIGRGNPRIYYNVFPRQQEKNYAEIFVELHEYDVNDFDRLINNLREHFRTYPGARINIKELEQGSPIEAPFTLKITGDNLDELKRISIEMEPWLRVIPGLVNLENRLDRVSTDIHFNINRDKAGVYGVPVFAVDKTIRTAIAGMSISQFRDMKGKEYDIVMRLPFDNKITLDDLQRIHVPSVTGSLVPLSQLTGIEFLEAPGIISRYNLRRDATLTADIRKGYYLDDIIERLEPKLASYDWPEGYHYTFTGELESREESFGGMRKASMIALLAIFAVLVLQFRSFRQPLIILSAIPLAAIGSTLALLITGNSFSFTAFVGLISLIGIVVNNSIILVDYTNLLRAEGKNLRDAIVEAGETRFTPIVLTTLTTTGGLLPLTLQGGSLWAPMGWTIIGGLVVSTFLTLVVIPVLYLLLENRSSSGIEFTSVEK